MDKKGALILAFCVTALIYLNYLFFTVETISREPVTIVRVLDGDTVELADGRRIRLLNVNTPEKGLAYSTLAKSYLETFVNRSIFLESHGTDLYGRTLGKLYDGETYLNLYIVAEGFAHAYLVLPEEEKNFEEVEASARAMQRGLWERSDFYGCLKATINKKEEYVVFESTCQTSLKQWTVKDESTKMYTIRQEVGRVFTLYSAKGTDGLDELYWGREKIWNDAGDEIFVRDSLGRLVYYDSYD
jgi:endonuclease YncB( thermonuclease family)